MTAEETPDILGDLIAEELVPILAELAVILREEGAEAVRGGLLRVQAVERGLSPELADLLAHTPGGVWGVALPLALAMVSPDAGMRSLLAWTETLTEPVKDRAEMTRDGGWDPPAERERQRLIAAGVPADTAIVMASRAVIEQQDTVRDRMLRVVARDGRRTA